MIPATVLSLAILGASSPTAADQGSAEKAVSSFNDAMLSMYHRGQADLTQATRPVMIIARDVTVVSENGNATYPRDAPGYNELKSTSHVVIGIIGAVTPWPQGESGKERWKRDFATISSESKTLLAAIDDLGLSKETSANQRAMLEKARAFVESAISQDDLTPEAVTQAINDLRPYWAENMRETARAELKTLHAAVSDARAAMAEEDWADMYVVSHGGPDVRKVNVVRMYLERVMPEKVAAGQVLYAEGVHGTNEMIKYVGYARMQRLVGAWAFGDPGRMEVDLLGYEAGSILDELIEVTPPVTLPTK